MDLADGHVAAAVRKLFTAGSRGGATLGLGWAVAQVISESGGEAMVGGGVILLQLLDQALSVHVLRLIVALVVFGVVGAVLGRTPVVKSCARVLIGGWMAMAITFGLTKLVGTSGLCT